MPRAPVQEGFRTGSLFSSPRVNYTSTTDAQRAPSAPFKVNVRMDQEGRVDDYNQGEILFGVYAFGSRRDHNISRAMSLWDLNYMLRRSHEHWVREFEHCTSVEDAIDRMRELLCREEYRFKVECSANVNKSFGDFLDMLELNNTVRIETFLKEFPYIGVTLDPNGTRLVDANYLSRTSGVKMFMCEAEGRAKVPNIWRAALPGTEVGFVVTKFTNPHALADDVNMGWRSILNALQPIQVWPVSNFGRRYPTLGMYSNCQAPSRGVVPLPDGASEFVWNERDPTKIQAVHWDYRMSVSRPDDHSAMEVNSWLEQRPSYYFPIGTVDTAVPGQPSVEEVCNAVSPHDGMFKLNTGWTRLMDK
jgi:hypothetical protein